MFIVFLQGEAMWRFRGKQRPIYKRVDSFPFDLHLQKEAIFKRLDNSPFDLHLCGHLNPPSHSPSAKGLAEHFSHLENQFHSNEKQFKSSLTQLCFAQAPVQGARLEKRKLKKSDLIQSERKLLLLLNTVLIKSSQSFLLLFMAISSQVTVIFSYLYRYLQQQYTIMKRRLVRVT